ELGIEQLRSAANAAQRIADLVREMTHQLAIRAGRLEQPLGAVEALALLVRTELEQHRHAGVRADDGRDDQPLRLVPRACERQIDRLLVEAARSRLGQQLLEALRFDELRGEAAPDRLPPRQAEQLFGRRVQEAG